MYGGVSWETPTNKTKEDFPLLVLGVMLVGLWLLEEELSGHMSEFYLYIYVHSLVKYRVFFGYIVNSMTSYDFFRHIYCYFTLSLLLLYLFDPSLIKVLLFFPFISLIRSFTIRSVTILPSITSQTS